MLVGSMAVLERTVPHDDVVHRQFEVPGFDPQARRGVPLRIEVDDQDPEPELGQCGTQIDRRGRLADPTFLVGHGDDPGQAVPRRRLDLPVHRPGPLLRGTDGNSRWPPGRRLQWGLASPRFGLEEPPVVRRPSTSGAGSGFPTLASGPPRLDRRLRARTERPYPRLRRLRTPVSRLRPERSPIPVGSSEARPAGRPAPRSPPSTPCRNSCLDLGAYRGCSVSSVPQGCRSPSSPPEAPGQAFSRCFTWNTGEPWRSIFPVTARSSTPPDCIHPHSTDSFGCGPQHRPHDPVCTPRLTTKQATAMNRGGLLRPHRSILGEGRGPAGPNDRRPEHQPRPDAGPAGIGERRNVTSDDADGLRHPRHDGTATEPRSVPVRIQTSCSAPTASRLRLRDQAAVEGWAHAARIRHGEGRRNSDVPWSSRVDGGRRTGRVQASYPSSRTSSRPTGLRQRVLSRSRSLMVARPPASPMVHVPDPSDRRGVPRGTRAIRRRSGPGAGQKRGRLAGIPDPPGKPVRAGRHLLQDLEPEAIRRTATMSVVQSDPAMPSAGHRSAPGTSGGSDTTTSPPTVTNGDAHSAVTPGEPNDRAVTTSYASR